MAKSKKGKNTGVFFLLLLGLGGGGLLAAYVAANPNARRVPDELRRPKPAQAQSHTVESVDKGTADTKYVKKSAEVPPGQDPIVYLVNESLKGTKVVPKGARLLGADVRDGVAYLDFNPRFQGGYSSTEEAIVLNAIMKTLKQFPEVKKVQFQIDGTPMETLGGHFELSEPIEVKLVPEADASTQP